MLNTRILTIVTFAAFLGIVSQEAQCADRPIVIEEFTGVWCTFCYGASIALERLESEYPRSEIIGVVYHIDDDFEIPFGYPRKQYYDVRGYPASLFNGVVLDSGGASFNEGPMAIMTVYRRFSEIIDGERARIAGERPFELSLQGDLDPEAALMTLKIVNHGTYSGTVNAVFLITENYIPVVAPNGQVAINSLARAHLDTIPLDLSETEIELNVAFDGYVPNYDPKNLHPTVFLQDEDTREILAAVGEFSDTSIRVWELY